MATSLPPGPSCPIGWQPSALAPVFYGYREYTAADGAPLTVRVYFPSLDGSPDSAEPLLAAAIWDRVAQPKYRVVFNGTAHFDYGGNADGLKILYAVGP